MDFSADHVNFVAASYALSGILILVLTVYVLVRDRKLCSEARRLDSQRRKGDA